MTLGGLAEARQPRATIGRTFGATEADLVSVGPMCNAMSGGVADYSWRCRRV